MHSCNQPSRKAGPVRAALLSEPGSSEGLDLAPLFPRQPSELLTLGRVCVLELSLACPLEGG